MARDLQETAAKLRAKAADRATPVPEARALRGAASEMGRARGRQMHDQARPCPA